MTTMKTTRMARPPSLPEPTESSPTDWSKVLARPGVTCPDVPTDPRICRALSSVDARVLAEDELAELRRLRAACLAWLQWTTNPLRAADKELAGAIDRAQRFTR